MELFEELSKFIPYWSFLTMLFPETVVFEQPTIQMPTRWFVVKLLRTILLSFEYPLKLIPYSLSSTLFPRIPL